MSGPEERRRHRRKRSDPSVVRVFKDKTGGSRWVSAYLGEVTEGGAIIALMTQLEIGSRVLIQGNLGEGRVDVPIDVDVKRCTKGLAACSMWDSNS